ELMNAYHIPPEKIAIVPSAWQHMQRVEAAGDIAAKWPALKPGEYYFSMSNLLKNKNFPWVLQAAKNSPDAVFAIAGGGSLQAAAGELGLNGLPNVQYLGYVTDAEAKALMAGCKAFLFPTLYEGFGIPPMEAIACGAPRVVVSDTPCMREVYGAHADYIDLATNRGDLTKITPGHHAEAVLAKYSWAASAKTLYSLLQQKGVE
ncbi:MAG: glycosyltransferase, partial [Gemmiger sp.]|nr:glycosyltransferase [Gemmiger sp.]